MTIIWFLLRMFCAFEGYMVIPVFFSNFFVTNPTLKSHTLGIRIKTPRKTRL